MNEERYNDGGLERDVKELKQDMKETQEDVKDTQVVVHELRGLLKGDPTSDKPGGLVHSVWRNTEFRHNAKKILWILFSLVTAVIIERLFRLM